MSAYEITDHQYDVVVVGAGGAGSGLGGEGAVAAGGGGKGGMAAEVGVDTAVEVGGPLMAGPAGTMEGTDV